MRQNRKPKRDNHLDRTPSQLWQFGPGQPALAKMQTRSEAGDFSLARVRLFLETISKECDANRNRGHK